jgi:hypothetical protein
VCSGRNAFVAAARLMCRATRFEPVTRLSRSALCKEAVRH